MPVVYNVLPLVKMDAEQQSSTYISTYDSRTISSSFKKRIWLPRNVFLSIGVVVLLLILSLFLISQSVVEVKEGYVGVFYKGGALQEELADPGFEIIFPFVTEMIPVAIGNRTEYLRDVVCATSSGVRGHFDRIEIVYSVSKNKLISVVKQYSTDFVSSLILSPLRHEIREFCARRSLNEIYINHFQAIADEVTSRVRKDLPSGVFIQAMRIPKPKIPDEIAEYYLKLETQKAQILVEREQKKLEEERAEIEKSKAVIEFQKQIELKKESDKLTVSRVQHVINIIAHVAQVIWKIFIGAKLPAL